VLIFTSSVCLQTNHGCCFRIADLFLTPCRCLHRAFVYKEAAGAFFRIADLFLVPCRSLHWAFVYKPWVNFPNNGPRSLSVPLFTSSVLFKNGADVYIERLFTGSGYISAKWVSISLCQCRGLFTSSDCLLTSVSLTNRTCHFGWLVVRFSGRIALFQWFQIPQPPTVGVWLRFPVVVITAPDSGYCPIRRQPVCREIFTDTSNGMGRFL